MSPDELRELVEEAGKYKDDGGFRVSRTDLRGAITEAAEEIELAQQRLGPAGWKLLVELKVARVVVEAARAAVANDRAWQCFDYKRGDEVPEPSGALTEWMECALEAYDLAVGKSSGEEK
jgi:hypothetical protein